MSRFLYALASIQAGALALLSLSFSGASDSQPQAIASSVQETGSVIEAARYGVSSGVDPASNAKALTKAFEDATSLRGPSTILLPSGTIALSGDVVLGAVEADQGIYHQQVIVKGAGAGEHGTWLHFTSGSLRIHSANHVLRDFRVTSDNADALIVEGTMGSAGSVPARSMMSNVRAEDSGGSGIVMSGNWIYLMVNVFARNNQGWGIEGRITPGTSPLSANSWTIVGGEFQGNGSPAGNGQRAFGGRRGTGGGVYTGRTVQFSMTGSVIEGNKGDGLKLGEQARGIGLYNVYFEKNGSSPENRDISNDPPAHPALGPSSVVIIGANFTAGNYGGVNQERAIDLWDVQGLHIVSPQFFGSSKAAYSQEPIRIRESAPGQSTGWIETPFIGWSGYSQPLVRNETNRFGWPTRTAVSPNVALAKNESGGQATKALMTVPVSVMAGRQVDVTTVVGAESWLMGKPSRETAGVAPLLTTFRRGPTGTAYSRKENVVNGGGSNPAALKFEGRSTIDPAAGFVSIEITRGGRDVRDSLASPVVVLSMEATVYEPVIGQ